MSLSGAKGTVSIIDKATSPLRNIAKSFMNMGKSADESTTGINKSTLALQKLSSMQNRLGRIQANNARKASNIGGQAVGVAAFGLALKSVLNPAIKFEQSMKNLESVTFGMADASVDVAGNMAKLSEQAQKLGATTAYTATQAAEAQLKLSQAGFKTNQMLKTMPHLLDLAAASGEDLVTVSDVLSDLMKPMGMTADGMGKFSDTMAAATSSANVTISTMFETLKDAGPIGKEFGASMQDMVTATAILGNVGIKGSKAGTAMKNAFANLAAPVGAATTMMKELGIQTKDSKGNLLPFQGILIGLGKSLQGLGKAKKIEAFSKIFGKEAMSGAINLEESVNSGDFAKMLKNLQNSEGVAKKMADIKMDSTEGSIKALMSAVEGVAITFGNLLTPALRGFAEITTTLGLPLQKLIKENEGVVKVLGLVAGAILTAKIASLAYTASLWLVSPALTLLSTSLGIGKLAIIAYNVVMKYTLFGLIPKFITAMGLGAGATGLLGTAITAIKAPFAALNLVMAANPIGVMVAGTVLLAAAGIAIYKNWDKITSVFKELWETIKLFDFSKMGESMNRITESIGLGSFFGDDENEKTTTNTNEVIKNIQGQNNISNQAVIQVNVANGQTNVQSKGDFDTQVEVNNGVQE